MKYIGLITVRTQSSRLKKKCLLKINNYSIIEICILKCLKANIVPIICTTNKKEDEVNRKVTNNNVFVGSTTDLQRMLLDKDNVIDAESQE